MLRQVNPSGVFQTRSLVINPEAQQVASRILNEIRDQGENAIRRWAAKLGDISSTDATMVLMPEAMEQAARQVDREILDLLRRCASRIESFAQAQRNSVREISIPVPGGTASQIISPVDVAGCYAPGGRYPLPSSVLMTAITARVAGCSRVIVATPHPEPVMLAAACVAGADAVLTLGGAQAIATLSIGLGECLPACDAIVGPGNAYVTAAKQLVSGTCRIDMLAGPSELVVLADETTHAPSIAADLLAQAEHDPDARSILVTTSSRLMQEVCEQLELQLESLPTANIARQALDNGFACVCSSIDEAIEVTNRIAPEHLHVQSTQASSIVPMLKHYGGLFIGHDAAEVLGDYAAGPNHTLPTGGTARSFGGLSVFDFLRIRTSLEITNPGESQELVRDAARLARIEHLEAHARSAEYRLMKQDDVSLEGASKA